MRTRFPTVLLVLGATAALAIWTQLDSGAADTQLVQSGKLALTAEDVAWATGWHIVKVECPATTFNGMQVLVLDGNGDVVARDSLTLSINHRPGETSLLRVAYKIEGTSVHGRMSTTLGTSTKFDYPDAFLGRHHAVHHGQEFENGQLILATEYPGKLIREPVARQVVVRLVKI